MFRLRCCARRGRTTIASACLLINAASARAQGPAAQPSIAGIWFGVSSLPGRGLTEDRLQIVVTADADTIMSAPFGRTPVSWGVVVPTSNGSIQFHWDGNPSLPCTLEHADQRTFAGTCTGRAQSPLPMTLTRNRPVDGLDLAVSDTDFRIVIRARQLLSGPPVWNRHDDRYCDDAPTKNSWSLFCAVYQASVDVAGKYLHFRPAVTETRAAIGDLTNGRQFNQILLEYNNDSSTTYSNIASVFDRATARLQARAECQSQRGARWSEATRFAFPVPKNAIPSDSAAVFFWGENTAQTGSYGVQSFVGPLTTRGDVQDAWVAASTSISVRTWSRGDFGGLDVTGELPDGNRWRYFGQCGESLSFYDVPPRSSVFFDHIIAGYFGAAQP